MNRGLRVLIGGLILASSAAGGEAADQSLAAWVEARGGVVQAAPGSPKSAGSPREFALIDFSGRPVGDADLIGIYRLGPISGIALSKTRVTNLGLKYVGQVRSLQSLTLDDTAIGDDGLGELAALPNLTHLSLYGTQVTSAGVRHLEALRHLTAVNLDHTQVDGDSLRYLSASGPALQELSLGHTLVADSGFSDIVALTQLRVLSLIATPITSAAWRPISRLRRLRSVQLDGTRVTAEGLQQLIGLPALRVLSLDDTSIGDGAEPYLARLRRLRLLSLVNTQLSPASFARLKSALPRCEIRGMPST